MNAKTIEAQENRVYRCRQERISVKQPNEYHYEPNKNHVLVNTMGAQCKFFAVSQHLGWILNSTDSLIILKVIIIRKHICINQFFTGCSKWDACASLVIRKFDAVVLNNDDCDSHYYRKQKNLNYFLISRSQRYA